MCLTFRYMMSVVSLLVPISCHTILLVGGLVGLQSANSYLASLLQTDAALRGGGLNTRSPRFFNSQPLLLLFLLGSGCQWFMSYKNTKPEWLSAPVITLLALSSTCTTCQIVLHMRVLAGKFSLLTHHLAEVWSAPVYLGRLQKVKVLSAAHGRFCDASEAFHRYYSLRLLALTVNNFISFVMNIYLFAVYGLSALGEDINPDICNSARDEGYNLGEKALLHFLWSVFFLELTHQLSLHCDHLARQVRNFSQLLYRIMVDDSKDEIVNDNKLQLHIAMRREVKLTASGFYPLDHTLIHSMIASATTYLVILIQFAEPTGDVAQSEKSPPITTPSTILTTLPLKA